MIKVDNNNNVIIEFSGKDYSLKVPEDYKNFIIAITDPNLSIDKSFLKVDGTITDDRIKSICIKYKEFFEEYFNKREEIIKNTDKVMKEIIDNTNL